MAAAGIGPAWPARSWSTPRAWAAAGALGTGPSVSDPRRNRGESADRPPFRVCHAGMAATLPATETVTVGPGPLRFDAVARVARRDARVELSPEAQEAMARSRAAVEALADHERPHYGVSTGFGALATRHIPLDKRAQLQRSLIRSHAAGAGPEVEREVVRAMMLLRLSTLATGRTGVRPATARAYAALLSAGITPVVHEHGSLGCSGDLAPLAHCALALMGEGEVRDAEGRLRDAGDA